MAPIEKLIYLDLILIIAFLPLSFSTSFIEASDNTRNTPLSRYKYGERIPLFVNKVFGADHDRCNVYGYRLLPFCPLGEDIRDRKKSLDEILAGDCLANTKYELKFNVSMPDKILCKKHLMEDDLTKLRSSIEKKQKYQMYFDNIWFWSKVGEVVEETGTRSSGRKFYLFNRLQFYVDFIENQVTGISIVNDVDFSVDITDVSEIHVNFVYSVSWNDMTLATNSNHYKSRNESETLWLTEEHEHSVRLSSFLYWTAITFCWIGSLLLLAAPLMFLILYFGNNRLPHGGISSINNKPCCCPPFSSLLGAILGVGTQHLIIISLLMLFAYEGIYPCNHERFFINLFPAYYLTYALSLFVSLSFHEKFSPIGWKECIVETGTLYIFPVLLSALLVNVFVARTYTFVIVVFALTIAGLGSAVLMLLYIGIRHFHKPEYDSAVCFTRSIVHVPPKSWYIRTPGQMILKGIVTISPIFFQMDEIYASLWGMKACGSFFILFIQFLYVVFATLIIGPTFTYYQLQNNDYQWWWRSVLRGGSPAIYMFVYGIYLLSKLKTESYLEHLPLLVYNGCICYSLFLVFGTVDFGASLYVFKKYMATRAKKQA